MMTITRGLVAGVVLAAAAVGLASPASAEPLSGTYTAVIGDSPTTTQTWVFTPCGPECTRLDIGEGAPIREMHLQGNTWSWSDNDPGVTCSTTIDNGSLAGTTGCGSITFRVQLTKVG